ncbi:nickel-responsive transcriptional regulator NikR [Methylobacterium trifolii]|uniref:Putative nickel-responsive regulator n=1 Tax=Methylobacterium trifolii TaxID=1003092 RepID=A0ABQ4TX73_9HYPH|nr:nickel-responsive transcriptional regulator NikR [Methylobacterium trifolii]GJE59104.1 Nickel-responsive regulator [Methylobacterium trifolii]
MQRITITIDDDLLAGVDQLCEQRGYGSRSEAVRDIVRSALAPTRAAEAGSAPCYGALSYVYSHGTRDLARRLTDEGHHHGVSVASMHVHLTRDDCLEVAVLRGSVSAMQTYADTVTTQRGVRYGHLHLIPEGDARHTGHDHQHGDGAAN